MYYKESKLQKEVVFQIKKKHGSKVMKDMRTVKRSVFSKFIYSMTSNPWLHVSRKKEHHSYMHQCRCKFYNFSYRLHTWFIEVLKLKLLCNKLQNILQTDVLGLLFIFPVFKIRTDKETNRTKYLTKISRRLTAPRIKKGCDSPRFVKIWRKIGVFKIPHFC